MMHRFEERHVLWFLCLSRIPARTCQYLSHAHITTTQFCRDTFGANILDFHTHIPSSSSVSIDYLTRRISRDLPITVEPVQARARGNLCATTRNASLFPELCLVMMWRVTY